MPYQIELELFNVLPTLDLKIGEEKISFGPDIVIAASGLGTFEHVNSKNIIERFLTNKKDLREIAKKFHRESTRRGHASITTSYIFSCEVRNISRIVSMLIVAPPFGSYLQESQRRSEIKENYYVIPQNLEKNFKEKLERLFQKSIKTYKELIQQNVEKEDARYILPLGIKTSVRITASFESYTWLFLLRKEVKDNPELIRYIPEEILVFAEILENKLKEFSPIIVEERLNFSNRLSTYPIANPFKPSDPIFNIVLKKYNYPKEARVVSLSFVDKEIIEEFKKIHSNSKNRNIKEIIDTINPLINSIALIPMSLAAYHQFIRHRTIPISIESIYDASQRALNNTEENIILPPSIKFNQNLTKNFFDIINESLNLYEQMIDETINPGIAVYSLPNALKIYILSNLNSFNLLYPSGFISARTCSTAQWEIRSIAYSIWNDIKKLDQLLGNLMGEKCKHLGFCPERKWCPIILKYYPNYNEEIHNSFNKK